MSPLRATRRQDNRPWFIYTQASSNYILKQWREDTEKLWVVTGLTLIIILIIGSLMTRKIQKSLHHEELNLERNQLAAYVFLYTNDLIVIANKNKKIIAVNPAFEKATGYNASEVLGTRPSGQSRELERKFYTNLWQALEKQTNWQGEVTQHRKDGSDITGWLQVSVIHDQQGKIVNYLGVLKDLSSLREHESLIHKLNLAVEQSPSSIIITNPNAEIEYANPQLLNSSGYSLEEVLGENPSKFQSKHTPTQTYKNLWQQISNGKVWQGEFINQRKTGDIYIERCTISPIFNSQAEISGYLGIKHDVTSEKEAEQALRLAASVIESTSEGVMICDANQKIIQINPAFSRITGYSIHEVSGRNPKMLAAEQRNDAIHTLMKATLTEQNSWEGEFWNRHKNGALYVIHSSISLIKDENNAVTHYISVFSDITQTKQHLANLEKQAHFDPLTGLPNRTLLNIRLEQALILANQNKSWLAVGFIDLDGFKAVNDSQGHQAGDELLIIIAERLTHALREQDTVARLGGDEFIILLKVHNLQECQNIAQRLLDIIAEPIPLSTGCLAKVTGSLGLTLYPQDKGDAAQLLRHADHAMYEAKQGGRNRFVISKKALNS